MNTTKQAIAASLKQLLLKKPITKITIKDIIEGCGVSRMTFYYHFGDIYDLVEWMCEEDARAALRENRTYDTWQRGFQSLLEAVRENKPFIVNVYRSVDRAQIERYLLRVTEKLLMSVIEEQAEGLVISAESKRYVANFFQFGFMGIMLEWIEHDMAEEPAKVAETTCKIIHGGFRRALERLSGT
ncbi:MAG: TetR family transcriptional regulator C-terminal domain-containing protein [Clostridia bacterium]|nr:TetR family transcriptional regulator C-terminal domain-containing protein [Clostridia bacterium]